METNARISNVTAVTETRGCEGLQEITHDNPMQGGRSCTGHTHSLLQQGLPNVIFQNSPPPPSNGNLLQRFSHPLQEPLSLFQHTPALLKIHFIPSCFPTVAVLLLIT